MSSGDYLNSRTPENVVAMGTQKSKSAPVLSESVGLAYSCKMCGMKPERIEDKLFRPIQFVCECGAAGSRADTTEKALVYWNKLAFCPNWNKLKERNETEIRSL